jgi:uncharacterized membrane protein YfcA
MTELLLVAVAAGLGGMLNAVAGGGSFFTLPALIWIGVPPVAANATGTAALLPGYVSSAWSDRHLMARSSVLAVSALLILGSLGGVAGALLLLLTTDQAFRALIPWLLLLATVLFAFGPRLNQWLAARAAHRDAPGIWGRFGVFGVAAYGGYFNGGVGIVVLALLRLMGEEDIRVANALKNLLAAVLTLIAVLIYAAGGLLYFTALVPMAVAAGLGGWLGVRLARHISPASLRRFIVAVGLVMTALFFTV